MTPQYYHSAILSFSEHITFVNKVVRRHTLQQSPFHLSLHLLIHITSK